MKSKLDFTKDKLKTIILELATLNGYEKPSTYLDELLNDVKQFNSFEFEGTFFLNIHHLCKENSEKFWSEAHRKDISKWLGQARIGTDVLITTWEKTLPPQQESKPIKNEKLENIYEKPPFNSEDKLSISYNSDNSIEFRKKKVIFPFDCLELFEIVTKVREEIIKKDICATDLQEYPDKIFSETELKNYPDLSRWIYNIIASWITEIENSIHNGNKKRLFDGFLEICKEKALSNVSGSEMHQTTNLKNESEKMVLVANGTDKEIIKTVIEKSKERGYISELDFNFFTNEDNATDYINEFNSKLKSLKAYHLKMEISLYKSLYNLSEYLFGGDDYDKNRIADYEIEKQLFENLNLKIVNKKAFEILEFLKIKKNTPLLEVLTPEQETKQKPELSGNNNILEYETYDLLEILIKKDNLLKTDYLQFIEKYNINTNEKLKIFYDDYLNFALRKINLAIIEFCNSKEGQDYILNSLLKNAIEKFKSNNIFIPVKSHFELYDDVFILNYENIFVKANETFIKSVQILAFGKNIFNDWEIDEETDFWEKFSKSNYFGLLNFTVINSSMRTISFLAKEIIKTAGTENILPPQQPKTNDKKPKISIQAEAFETIYSILKNFFEDEQQNEFKEVFKTFGTAKNKLIFKSNGNQFADTFKQLFENKFIVGCQKTDLIYWIALNFNFMYRNNVKEFKEKTLEQIISGNQTPCKNAIIEVKEGKILRKDY